MLTDQQKAPFPNKHAEAVKLVKKIFYEILRGYLLIQNSRFKKIYVEEVKNHKEYLNCIAINLRWGKKLIYDYICCHIEESTIAFPHNLALNKIDLNEFLLNKKGFLRNVAHMLSEPLHTDLNLKKSYSKTVQLLNNFREKGILGKNLVNTNALNDGFKTYSIATEYFVDELRNFYSSSAHPSYEKAFIKSVIEAVEWSTITWKKKDSSDLKRFTEIKQAIDPALFAIFNINSITSTLSNRFLFDSKDAFRWTKVYDIIKRKHVLIPSQLIYSKYYLGDEKVIRVPISTGSAAHYSHKKALLNGLCEVIERDNFSLHYLTSTSPKNIIFENDEKLNTLINKLQINLGVKITLLDFSYDFPTYSIGVVFLNRKKSLISIGLNCNFDVQKAIENALFEAYKMYMGLINIGIETSLDINFGDVASIFKKNRQLWLNEKPISKLEFLFEGKNIDIETYKPCEKLSLDKKIELLMATLKKDKYRIFIKHFTIHKPFLHIVKIIVPNLTPLPLLPNISYKKTQRIAKFVQNKKKTYMPLAIPPPFY